ncbi:MAG: hypothetical protein ACR2ND_09535 [Solirubrobacteraceae bacterium]
MFRGHLLDLRTTAFALTNQGHTLESACRAFAVRFIKREVQHGRITPEYVDYNREDVGATAQLFEAVVTEYARHPIDLQPTSPYSPASIGKANLRAMGVRPPLERQPDFPRELLGSAMTAYFGGRTECRIRRAPVPVIYLDFLAMYSTVCALVNLWRLLTAGSLRVVKHEPALLQAQLDALTADQLFDRDAWPQLVGLAWTQPTGDILPVRARYARRNRNFGIGVNPLTCDEPLPYALPDVYAAALLGGRAPKIVRHITFEPVGRTQGLRPVALRGEVEIDPRRDDLFKALVEQRKRIADRDDLPPVEREWLNAFLKVFGIFHQLRHLRRDEPPGAAQRETRQR